MDIFKLILMCVLSSILINVINCSRMWTYTDSVGYVNYCCMCRRDHEMGEIIQECLLKNEDDPRKPYCNCNHNIFPECPAATTICNRNLTCPETLVYKECDVPFLNNTKLFCNDSLQWEAKFTCPHECPAATTICNRNLICPETGVHKECDVPFLNNAKLFCNDSLQWDPNFTCPHDVKPITNQAPIIPIIIGCIGGVLLVILAVCCFAKAKKKAASTINENGTVALPLLADTINENGTVNLPLTDQLLNPEQGEQGQNGNQQNNTNNNGEGQRLNPEQGEQGQNGNQQNNTNNNDAEGQRLNPEQGEQGQNGNQQNNTNNNGEGQRLNPEQGEQGQNGNQQNNTNNNDAEADTINENGTVALPLTERMSVEESGQDTVDSSRNNRVAEGIQPLHPTGRTGVENESNFMADDEGSLQEPHISTEHHLYQDLNPPISLASFSSDSFRDLRNLEDTTTNTKPTS